MDAPAAANGVGFAPKVGSAIGVVVDLKEPKVAGTGDDPGPNELEDGDKEKMDLTGALGCDVLPVPKTLGFPKTPTTGLEEVLEPVEGRVSAGPPNRLEEDDLNGEPAGGAVLLLSLAGFGAPNKLELDA